MAIVGLADKAVAESPERVRAALSSIGLALPPKRIAVNLAPADVLKEGAHFDLIIEVPEISAGVLLDQGKGEPRQTIAARVAAARQFGSAHKKNKMANAMISIDQLDKQIIMEKPAEELLRAAMDKARLSARAYHKIMRVSRTIADLAGEDRVSRDALAEALAYRAMPLLA